MRTLFGKIVVWFLATTMLTLAAVVVTSALAFDTDRQPPFGMLLRTLMREARHAYERGGRAELAETLARLRSTAPGDLYMTDAAGRDLVTGEDRSALIREARQVRRWRFALPFARPEVAVWGRQTGDLRYWFFVTGSPRRTVFWFVQPEHLWILGVAVLLCYALAYHLTSPVRKLQRAVDRFGAGELSTRAPVERRDELGQLARTFNQMAGRIETLVAAQRRLLLDISHELRSPLARLNLAIELARGAEDAQSCLDRIQKEADRLNVLVSELLEVTRAEADPSARRVEMVRLDELVGAVVEDSRLEADARGCRVELQAVPAAIEGDPELLRRASENVIRNAIRYAPEGTAVEVRLDNDGQKLHLRVRDYGPGVPAASLPLLFEPFYRVEEHRGRQSGGSGLGLAIARRAIQLHDGSIHAENANPGLAVEIVLPAARTTPAAI